MSRKIATFVFAAGFLFSLAAAEARIQTAPAEPSRKHTDAEYKIAFAYCDAVRIAETQRNMRTLLLDNITKGNPAMRELRPALEPIFNRCLNYEAVKYDYADIFLDEFTLDEIKELTRISQLPVMQKSIAKQQKLMRAGSEIAKNHLALHQEEIRATIKAFILKKAAEKAAAEKAAAEKAAAEAENIQRNNTAKPAAK